MAESEEELKSLLMKVKEESERVGLKLNIPNTKIMASGPITSWQIDGKTVETVTDFTFGAPKSQQMVTAAMKLKVTYMSNLYSILNSRGITLLTKICLAKAMVFPVVMYGCESWAIKKTEHQRIGAPLDCKEIQAVRSEGDQPWDFFGRTDAKAEAPVLWPSHAKS